MARAASVAPPVAVDDRVVARLEVDRHLGGGLRVDRPGAGERAAGRPPLGTIASDSAFVAWLVTMKTTGPAPTDRGDTETRALLM